MFGYDNEVPKWVLALWDLRGDRLISGHVADLFISGYVMDLLNSLGVRRLPSFMRNISLEKSILFSTDATRAMPTRQISFSSKLHFLSKFILLSLINTMFICMERVPKDKKSYPLYCCFFFNKNVWHRNLVSLIADFNHLWILSQLLFTADEGNPVGFSNKSTASMVI